MGLPFQYMNSLGYRFSPGNHAILTGCLSDSLGLSYATNVSDMQVRAGFHYIPTTNFNPFVSYDSITLPFDALASQTINYFDQFSRYVGGPGIFDANGKMNLAQPLFNGAYIGGGMGGFSGLGGFGNFTMPSVGLGTTAPWSNGYQSYSYLGNNGNNGNNGTPDATKETQIGKMKNLFNAYKNNAKNLSDEMKAKIDNATGKTGSQDERLKALKDLYNEIDKQDLMKAIPFAYYADLYNMGYNFELADYSLYKNNDTSSIVQNAIGDLALDVDSESSIATIAGNLTTLVTTFKVADPNQSTGILRAVSTWNDKTDKNIIEAITEYVTGKGNPDEYQGNITTYVKPLVDALQHEVTICRGLITNDADIDKLDKLSEALGKSYTKVFNDHTNTNKINTLAENFNKLYVMLRRCEAKYFDEKIKKEYGFIDDIQTDDTNIIPNVVSNATEADLEKEGLDGIDCTPSGLNENDTVEDQVAELCKGSNPYLTRQKVEVDGTEVVLYWAKELDNKVYTLGPDGKLYEVTNAEINGDNVTLSEAPELADESVTPKSIQEQIDGQRDAAAEAEQAAQEEQYAINEARDKGNQISTKLKEGNSSEAVSMAKSLTADAAVEAIVTYNAHPNAKNRANKYFERLSDAGMTVDEIKKQVNGILAKAEKLGLTDTDSYKKVKAIIAKYESGGERKGSSNMDHRYKEKANKGKFWKVADTWESISISAGSGVAIGAGIGFVLGPAGSAVGAIVGAVAGAVVGAIGGMAWGKVSDVEVLDEYVLELCNEIKSKENGTSQ